MTTQLPFFGRESELQLLHDAWRAATDPATRTPQIVTFVAETGVGKSRIIQEFYRQLTVSETWDKGNFWPDAFQSYGTQLHVNPEFPDKFEPNGPPQFLWLGVRWHNVTERNVANSQALPTIKEQLLAFNQHITDMRSRLQRILDAGKEEVRKLITIRGALNLTLKFVPYGDAISNLWEYGEGVGREVLGIKSAPKTLPDQLMELCHIWFNSTDATPIILWLDDAQWIDKEATEFFTELMRTARTKRWPLLLIATSWPMEWNQFSTDFFLKHDTATTVELSNAADAELRALLHAAFPHLPPDQVKLIVHKAGGNFLNMIENIAVLRTQPRYFFLHGDSTQPLSETGVNKIRTWKSERHARIEQRFHEEFDDDIKDFLARASQTGLDTQFLQRVLVRCHTIYANAAQVTALLTTCSASLAVIVPMSPSLHEFRDRGYFAVAQQHFEEILHNIESTPLHDALVAELTDQVQSAFDDDGDLCDPQTHPASLRAAPSREQFLILDLALRILTPNTPVHVRALVAMVARSAAENAWDEIRTLVQPSSGATATDHFAVIDWATHAGSSVSWGALSLFAATLHDAGAIAQTGILAKHMLSYNRAQHAARNTPDSLRNLSAALNFIGRFHLNKGELTAALQSFSESLYYFHQLVDARSTPDDLLELSVTLNHVGRIHLANGDLTAALQSFSESLNYSRQLVDARGTPDDLFGIPTTLFYIGLIHRTTGDFTLALQYFSESLNYSRQLVATHGNSKFIQSHSATLNEIGRIHRDNNDLTIALQYFSEALTFSRQAAASRGTPNDLRELSIALNDIGNIHRAKGVLTAALQCFNESLTIKRQILQDPRIPEDLHGLSATLTNIGHIYLENGDLTAALTSFSEALKLSRQLVTSRGSTDDIFMLSVSINNVGIIHYARGNRSAALTSQKEALKLSRRLVATRGAPKDMKRLFESLTGISIIHHYNRNRAAALACATEALAVARQARQRAPHIFSDADMAYLERRVNELS